MKLHAIGSKKTQFSPNKRSHNEKTSKYSPIKISEFVYDCIKTYLVICKSLKTFFLAIRKVNLNLLLFV